MKEELDERNKGGKKKSSGGRRFLIVFSGVHSSKEQTWTERKMAGMFFRSDDLEFESHN